MLFSISFVFAVLAETADPCEQCCDCPCPVVCMGGTCGIYCDASVSERSTGPEETGNRITPGSASVPAARIPADEIFHPPLA